MWVDEDPGYRRDRFAEEPARRRKRSLTIAVSVSAVLLITLVGTVLAIGITSHGRATAPRRSAGQVPTGPSTQTQTLSLPSGMPTHFAFGVMNGPGDVALLNDMRTHNGTAWDFRYQYLSCGVNTSAGWATWNQPEGQFATNYLQESISDHYIPAFVYYNLLQSDGSQCGPSGNDEQARDLAHLNTPDIMAAYYANWRLLMQKIGAVHTPVLVVVEPDLWAFMQQSVIFGSNSAAGVPASVASSGDPDAAGLPNTAQGFAWALLRIRDRYAPNALLALHVSAWATQFDLGSSTDPGLNPSQVADTTAQFLLTAGLRGNPRGISTWDLLSSDVSDRDSGQGAAWWDPTNQAFPNFARYLSFVKTITAETGRPVVMWQVPEGNQYFDTMDDSNHHTQDNRAQYILGHIPDFARAGVVAVLFGPGNGGTIIDDAAHDGITNPQPISSYQCDRCNTHVSSYPDDDGGYLRIFVGAYYRAGPLSLASPDTWKPFPTPNIPTATPVPQGTCIGTPVATIGQVTVSPNPVAPGKQVTVSAHITLNCDTPVALEYDIYGQTLATSILKLPDFHEDFKQGQTRVISLSGILPAQATPGNHSITIGVFALGFPKSTPPYGYVNPGIVLQVT
jgi:hypothetical protein